MSGVLERILASKREEIRALRAARAGEDDGSPRWAPRRVLEALRRGPSEPLRLIAEIKRRSPSAGALSTALSTEARAIAYAEGGAAMISVLCDGPFFGGGFDDLRRAREALGAAGHATRLLAKEFVLDDAQVAEAAASGADSVLLIARIVEPGALRGLVAAARARGLEPLVEVVTEAELEAAMAADARLVGVNARDLDTLVMDAERAARVLAAIPAGRVPVHLSGLKTPADVRAIAASGAHAALVGEALMRKDDPGPLLAAMVRAGGAQT